MLLKVLSWLSLATALVFVALMLSVLFAASSLGPAAMTVVAPVAIGSLVLSMLLAVTVLVLGAMQ
jgi:hypothetical protein